MTTRLAIIRAGWLPSNQANAIQTLDMASALGSAGAEPTVYYMPNRRGKPDVRRRHGIPERVHLRPLPHGVLPLPKRFELRSPFDAPAFVHALLWARDAVHRAAADGQDAAYVREPLLAYWASRAGLRTVLELHGMPSSPAGRRAISVATSQPGVTAVIAVTAHLRDDLVAAGLVPVERTVVMHDGVDVEMFDTGLDRLEARHSLGLPEGRPIAMYVGGGEANRGASVLAAASALLPQASVVIIGPDRPGDGGRKPVTWVPRVPRVRVPEHLAAADVLVVPGTSEIHYARHASPMKLFEYMASRRPIVASDLPGMGEVLEHGRSAWLVEPGSPSALAAGITSVLEDSQLAAQLAAQSRAEVERFSWTARAQAIADLF